MARALLLVALGAVWLSPWTASSSLYFDFGDVSVRPDEPLELACGVEGHFRLCVWETQRGESFQVEDVHAGLHPGLWAPANLTNNQCGIVVDALMKRRFGTWTCRVYLAGSTFSAEKTVGKALECPANFKQVGSGCYFIHETYVRPWDEARDYCKGLNSNADLAVLDDCYQLELVWNYILFNYGDNYYWVGGSNHSVDGSWHWVTGAQMVMGVPFWSPGQPSGDGGCVDLLRHSGYVNDGNCSLKLHFVCQVLY